jgi:hypothetical protein
VRLNAIPIDKRSIAGAEIAQDKRIFFVVYFSVNARRFRVIEMNLAVTISTDPLTGLTDQIVGANICTSNNQQGCHE